MSIDSLQASAVSKLAPCTPYSGNDGDVVRYRDSPGRVSLPTKGMGAAILKVNAGGQRSFSARPNAIRANKSSEL